jgi:hypothetical protein
MFQIRRGLRLIDRRVNDCILCQAFTANLYRLLNSVVSVEPSAATGADSRRLYRREVWNFKTPVVRQFGKARKFSSFEQARAVIDWRGAVAPPPRLSGNQN